MLYHSAASALPNNKNNIKMSATNPNWGFTPHRVSKQTNSGSVLKNSRNITNFSTLQPSNRGGAPIGGGSYGGGGHGSLI